MLLTYVYVQKIDIYHMRALSYTYITDVINVIYLVIVFFFYQQTPLHITTENGYTYTVEALAAKGADISAKDNAGVSIGD